MPVPSATAPGRAAARHRDERACAKATNISREAALAFLDVDANGDGVLQWDEVRWPLLRWLSILGPLCVMPGLVVPFLQLSSRHSEPQTAVRYLPEQFVQAIRKLRGKEGSSTQPSVDEERELRHLFQTLDANNSGTIEMDEWFVWTLDLACQQGCGLEAIFRKYDTSGEGVLDASEFALAVEDLGFTATFAHDLFVELDDDNSGSVSCSELTQTIKNRVGGMTADAKKVITTLAFQDASKWSRMQQVESTTGRTEIGKTDISQLSNSSAAADSMIQANKGTSLASKDALKGPDGDSLRKQIQSMLRECSLRDSDLYNLLVMPLVKGEATRTLTKDVFVEGLKRLGYVGPIGMLLSLFKKMDSDGSGVLGFSELREWMTGRMDRIMSARRVHLLYMRSDGKSLDQLRWTPNNLRRALVRMLQRAELSPLDLVRAWDQSNDNSFSQREFLIMMKNIVFTVALASDPQTQARVAQAKLKAAEIAKAETEAQFQWQMTKVAGTSAHESVTHGSTIIASMACMLNSSDRLAREAAATSLQAFYRARITKQHAKRMSKAEADHLWYSRIKPVVLEVFRAVAGADGSMDIEEFLRWINFEWRVQQIKRKQNGGLILDDDEEEEAQPIEAAVSALQQRLRSLLVQDHLRVIDLFRQMDYNRNGTLSKAELRCTLQAMGEKPPEDELAQLFRFLE